MSAPVYELLYDEYAALTQKYKALYGELTIVTIQVGKFLEYYNCDQKLGVDVKAISKILGIQATRKNKLIKEISRKNLEFTGFPMDKSHKFIPLLLEAGYTVVLYMQKGEAPNITREVVEIVSPSTASASAFLSENEDGTDQSISSCLMSIYLDATSKTLTCGWAVIDLSTGRSYVSECTHSPLDALRRAVVSYGPCEAVFFREGKELPSVETMCAHVGMRRRTVHDRSDKYKTLMSPARQNAILEKAYSNTGFLTPAEFVNLERSRDALIALVAAIEFAHEHNPSILHRIHVPEIVCYEDETTQWMDLGPDTVRKLDVVSHLKGDAFDEPQATLLDVLNRCRTPSGKRSFKDRLLHPICSTTTMEARYDAVDGLISRGYDDLIPLLDGIGNLEKMFRKVVNLKRFSKAHDDLTTIACWLKNSEDAIVAWKGKCGISDAAHSVWAAIDSRVDQSLDESFGLVHQGESHGQEVRSFFRRGVHASVDAAQDELDMSIAVFHAAASALNSAIGSDHVKVDSESGGMIGLTVTAKRWNDAVACGAASKSIVEPWFVGSDATLGGPVSGTGKNKGGVRRLEHPALGASASDRVARARAALEIELRDKTMELIEELDEAHSDSVNLVVREIDELDVALTCARNAKAMGHVRPTLTSAPSSYLNAKGLRHPIIESLMLDRKERFVPNDISLGCIAADRSSSMLLYGVNAVGKSSLMKSVGLAVIMAQSGMFVAADSLELSSYRELYTRVGLHDDLTRGHSTFVCEMLELRTILRQATHRSLIIGDELCAGTESQSAISIVGAAVSTLCEKNASFLFATHIHELVEIPTVASLIKDGKVMACHLSVHSDLTPSGKGKLVMDRKLAPGTGPPTYGLEVCRSLDMEPSFLEKADEIRKQVASSPLLSTRRSRYNAKVIVDSCGICGKPATETHHLEHQAVAESHVKNRRHNLVPLCDKCHDEVHSGKIEIEGYKATSEGIELSMNLNLFSFPPTVEKQKLHQNKPESVVT